MNNDHQNKIFSINNYSTIYNTFPISFLPKPSFNKIFKQNEFSLFLRLLSKIQFIKKDRRITQITTKPPFFTNHQISKTEEILSTCQKSIRLSIRYILELDPSLQINKKNSHFFLDFYHKNSQKFNLKKLKDNRIFLLSFNRIKEFHSFHLSKIGQIYSRARSFLATKKILSPTKIQFIKKDRENRRITG